MLMQVYNFSFLANRALLQQLLLEYNYESNLTMIGTALAVEKKTTV